MMYFIIINILMNREVIAEQLMKIVNYSVESICFGKKKMVNVL